MGPTLGNGKGWEARDRWRRSPNHASPAIGGTGVQATQPWIPGLPTSIQSFQTSDPSIPNFDPILSNYELDPIRTNLGPIDRSIHRCCPVRIEEKRYWNFSPSNSEPLIHRCCPAQSLEKRHRSFSPSNSESLIHRCCPSSHKEPDVLCFMCRPLHHLLNGLSIMLSGGD